MLDTGKTTVWTIHNNITNDILGKIKWYGPWRQYCLHTIDNVVFNDGCLSDIIRFIKQLMEERKHQPK
jgi:hypothetical protein